MNQYNLTNEEDMQLRFSIMFCNNKSLYTYFCNLPLEQLKAYPQKGYRWWMGKAARSPKALALRDYILHWRLAAIDFREAYSKETLEKMSYNELQAFLKDYIEKVPLWAYEELLRDATEILLSTE